ncbi:restriction endonuclease subunit S [Streptococcus pluranimalium]|uniref:restriction endonuclease subunit S n=1 Tax=Streptococcus pluranimalium TaxID=82348 RepID=UPI003F66F9B9
MTKQMLSERGKYPTFSSDSTNNGIVGYSNISPSFLCDEDCPIFVIFGDHTRTFNIAQTSFNVMDNVKVLKPNKKYKLSELLFITSSWKKGIKNLGYARHWKIAKEAKILLPTKNNQIDFDFMEFFIAELEAERIAELSAYLTVSGLDNCKLSIEELNALRAYDSMEWREYKLGDLFEIRSYKKRFDANKVIILDKGEHPYIVRKSANNGIRGFIDEDTTFLNEGNTISFGQDTATSFYQEQPYFTGDKIKILKAKFDGFKKENAQFFISAITRSFSKFSWGSSSYSIDIISNQTIVLPVLNEKPDMKYIEIITKAIAKLAIKDVVQYTDKRIEATKAVVLEHQKTTRQNKCTDSSKKL